MPKYQVHDYTSVPKEPLRMQHRLVTMPNGFLCIVCCQWKPAGRLATVYWNESLKWHSAGCAHHPPRNGWSPENDIMIRNVGQYEDSSDAATQHLECIFARDAVYAHEGRGILLTKNSAFMDTLRVLWRALFGSGEPGVMQRVMGMRNVPHEKVNDFIQTHPAVIVLVAKLASLCGLELTKKSEARVSDAKKSCQTFADLLP